MKYIPDLPYRYKSFVKGSCYFSECGLYYCSRRIRDKIQKNINMQQINVIASEIRSITYEDVREHVDSIRFATTTGNVRIKLNATTTSNVTIAGF